MKIGFLGPGDPKDVRSYSGVPYFTHAALVRQGADLVTIDAGDQMNAPVSDKINNISRRLMGRTVLASEHVLARRLNAARANAQIRKAKLDALICLNVDFLIPMLTRRVPLVHNSDTTFAAIMDYYPTHTKFWGPARRRADAVSKAALSRADVCSYPSDWAAKSAQTDYGVPAEKTHVVPYGANLDDPPSREEALSRTAKTQCNLLFIGGDWERKGGPVAFETMCALRDSGIDASLTVVGADPGVEHPNLRRIGFLNKQIPEDLALYETLWKEASFLCMPSQAETFGAIYSEAAAHGLPVIARDTGGVSGCIVHGQSGMLLAEGEGSAIATSLIRNIWTDEASYANMVRSARDRFETVLNWDAWARSMLELVEVAVRDRT